LKALTKKEVPGLIPFSRSCSQTDPVIYISFRPFGSLA